MEVKIKEIADSAAESVGLDKYGRSKIPGTKHVIQAGEGPDGRWITGIDDQALSINRLEDVQLREKVKKEKIKIRERLEKALGVNLDAAPSNPFWDTFFVDITGMRVVDMSNPRDELALEIAIANGDIAPSLEATSLPEYRRAKFYRHVEEEESKLNVSKARIENKAKAGLEKLAENPKRLDLVARYTVPRKLNRDMSPDSKYQVLNQWLTETPKDSRITNAEKFLRVLDMKNDELFIKILLDEAIARSVIRYREGLFQRGNVTYGRTMEEMLDFFKLDQNQAELGTMKAQMETEFAFKI